MTYSPVQNMQQNIYYPQYDRQKRMNKKDVALMSRLMQPQTNAVKIDIINPEATNAQNPYCPDCCPRPGVMPYSQIPTNAYSGMLVQTHSYNAPLVQQTLPSVMQEAPAFGTVTQNNNEVKTSDVPAPNFVEPNDEKQDTTAPVADKVAEKETVKPAVVVKEKEAAPVADKVAEKETVKPAVAGEIKEKEAAPAVDKTAENETAKPAVAGEVKDIEIDKPSVVYNPNEEPQAITNSIVEGLNSEAPKQQIVAMQKIMVGLQSNPEDKSAFLNKDVVNGLSNIIKKDTSSLEAPTQRQLELRIQLSSGKNLTDEEMAEAEKQTPKDMADGAKQLALLTLAKIQCDANDEAKSKNGTALKFNELPGIETTINALDNEKEPNANIRGAAIASLFLVSKTTKLEDKNELKSIFETVIDTDKEEKVKDIADFALSELEKSGKGETEKETKLA